jgi:hypothetical protein
LQFDTFLQGKSKSKRKTTLYGLGENFRAINAVLLQGRKLYSDKVIADGYDTKLTAFEVLIPALILSFEKIT